MAIGPVTGPLFPWLLVRQLVTWSSTNQIHAIFMRSTMRFMPYLHSSRIAVSAVAIGPVTGPLFPWLLVRQLVTWSSTNQIHAIFMRSTMRFMPYLHSSRIAVSSVQSDIFSPVGYLQSSRISSVQSDSGIFSPVGYLQSSRIDPCRVMVQLSSLKSRSLQAVAMYALAP